jgi:hypothetical protein
VHGVLHVMCARIHALRILPQYTLFHLPQYALCCLSQSYTLCYLVLEQREVTGSDARHGGNRGVDL